MTDLSTIIVSYNTADLLRRCLSSIDAQPDINFETIVVDNASQDESRQMIRSEFPWVKLIENERNLGFARANNQALKICKTKYVYFLNPDTEVRPNVFKTMVKFMDSHPEAGLAGTRISNPDGSPQLSVESRYPGEKYAKQALKALKGDIAWVSGASMIARRSIVELLGGFDENFFLYGEEQDLCLRIRKSGWTIGYITDAVVVHWGGQSERNNRPSEVWKKKFDAELIFYKKHYTEPTILAIKRANRIKAYWRVLTLRITIPFFKNKEKHLNKLAKYRLVLDTFV